MRTASNQSIPPYTAASGLAGCLDRLSEFFERRSLLTVIVFSICYWAVSCGIAQTKLLWYDELWSYYPATLPSWKDTWNFYASGADAHTPLTSLAIRASIALFGASHVAVRLPDIFFFWLMCICIYLFVSYRRSRSFALAAMIFPVIAAFYYYATEARDYGILIGCAAAALVCWQRASALNGRRSIWFLLLWLCTAATVCVHYFGVLFLIALFAGEVAKAISRKRIDWPVIGALILGAAPLLAFVPMALAMKANYGAHPWIHTSLSDIENTYRSGLDLAMFPLLAAIVLWGIAILFRRQMNEERRPIHLPHHETVAATTLALLPLCIVPLSFVIGSFLPRYILYTMVGVTISLALLAYRSTRADRLMAACFIVVFFGWYVVKSASLIRHNEATNDASLFHAPHPFEDTRWMPLIERSDLPVAVTPAVFYLQFQHYALPTVKSRLIYLTNSEDAIRYSGTDVAEQNFRFLRGIVPVQIEAYDQFVPQHSHFLLCAETTNINWLLEKLLHERVPLKLIAEEGSYFLFDVETGNSGTR